MQRRYDCLIFDADYTLLDYIADEMNAFARLYQEIGMETSAELFADSRRLSETAWTAAGLYDVDDLRVQERYHSLYRTHVEHIFLALFQKYGVPKSGITAKATGEKFLQALATQGTKFCGVEETLARLSRKTGGEYDVCIATNGLEFIQRARLTGLEKYADIYVSETVGAIKPRAEFFEYILKDRGVEKGRCLMIGDSIVSDIVGAKAVGIDACWYNPTRKKNLTAVVPEYEIDELKKVENILQ